MDRYEKTQGLQSMMLFIVEFFLPTLKVSGYLNRFE